MSPVFYPDFNNLSLLSFFLVSLANILSILLIFSKNHLLVSLILSIAFVFSISRIYALIFIFFILLSLGLT